MSIQSRFAGILLPGLLLAGQGEAQASTPGLLPAQEAPAGAEPAPVEEVPNTGESPAPEEPSPPEAPPEDVPGETIVVFDQQVARTRDELELTLRDLGYHAARTRNGREYFDHESAWKPQVVLDDDGWVRVRRGRPRFEKPKMKGIWDGPLGYAVCVVTPTSCVRLGGMFVTERRLEWSKDQVTRSMEPARQAWETALVERNMAVRTGEEVPTALEALWEDGVPFQGDLRLEGPAERKQALVRFWLERTDDVYGDQVRQVVEDFVRAVVQTSEHPFSAEEIAEVNARRTCRREFRVPAP